MEAAEGLFRPLREALPRRLALFPESGVLPLAADVLGPTLTMVADTERSALACGIGGLLLFTLLFDAVLPAHDLTTWGLVVEVSNSPRISSS